MIPYFALMSVPSFLTLFGRRTATAPVLITAVIYILFVGLRYQVGADWNGYIYLHKYAASMSPIEILSKSEQLSLLLFKLSETAGYDMSISNFVAALLLMAGVVALALRTVDPLLAIVAATPYLIVAFGMSGIRQAMGVGLIFFTFAYWPKWGLIRRSAGIFIASLFHTSAIVAAIYLVISIEIKTVFKVILIPIILFFGMLVGSNADQYKVDLDIYQARYLGEGQIQSSGALFHILLVLLPAIFAVVFRKRIRSMVFDYQLLQFGVVSAFGVAVLYMFSSTAASRLSLYLYFVPMIVYPALTRIYGERKS